jgi:hypothetical protein
VLSWVRLCEGGAYKRWHSCAVLLVSACVCVSVSVWGVWMGYGAGLQEPTNHLDLETIDGLVDALNRFEGGILIVTHNVSLISKVCNEIWECGLDRTVSVFPGEFEDYAARLVRELKEAEVAPPPSHTLRERQRQSVCVHESVWVRERGRGMCQRQTNSSVPCSRTHVRWMGVVAAGPVNAHAPRPSCPSLRLLYTHRAAPINAIQHTDT